MKNVILKTIGVLALSTATIASSQARTSWDDYERGFSCNRKNAAYEKSANIVDLSNVVLTSDALPKECVQFSMYKFKQWSDSLAMSKKPFAQCKHENSRMKRLQSPLCRTKKLVSKIRNAYNVVTDCFDLAPKLLFPIVSVESGFFPNIIGVAGDDAGIGQVTGAASGDVNDVWAWVKNYVKDSDKSSCKALAPKIDKFKVAKIVNKNPCQMIAPTVNPFRNLVYTASFFMLNKKYFISYIDENSVKERLEKIMKRSLSADEAYSTVDLLVFHAYNKGFGSAKSIYLKYLAKLESSLGNKPGSLSLFAINNSKSGSLHSFMKKSGKAAYVDLLARRVKGIERVVGKGTCNDNRHGVRSDFFDIMDYNNL